MTAPIPHAVLPAGLSPTDLPWVERPGVTVRYHVGEDLVPALRAVLNRPAETVVRRPGFVKEYVL